MPRNELYIGNLHRDVSSKDIESVFKRHGKILRCDIKNRGSGYGPVYAFIEYDDERDAEDAIRAENGKELLGSSMLVEFTKGRGAKRGRGGDDRGRNGFGSGRSMDCYECGRPGHFARECPRRGGRGGRDRSRSRSRSRDRRRDRSRSRDRKHRRDRTRSRSRQRDRSRSRSPAPRDKSRDRSRERSRHTKSKEKRVLSKSKSRSPTRSRTRSPRSARSARSAARSATPRSRGASHSPPSDRHQNGDNNNNDEVNMD